MTVFAGNTYLKSVFNVFFNTPRYTKKSKMRTFNALQMHALFHSQCQMIVFPSAILSGSLFLFLMFHLESLSANNILLCILTSALTCKLSGCILVTSAMVAHTRRIQLQSVVWKVRVDMFPILPLQVMYFSGFVVDMLGTCILVLTYSYFIFYTDNFFFVLTFGTALLVTIGAALCSTICATCVTCVK
jgi:hypothetical protein